MNMNEYIDCPYDKAHLILKHRFQTHLVKCRKNFPNANKKMCPFNSTHMCNEQEFDHHLTVCNDRSSFDRYKYQIQSGIVKTEKMKCEQDTLPPPKTYHDGSEENWDDEDVPTYNPQKYVESAPIIRTLNLAPPAERNAFREAERLRMNGLQSKNYDLQ